jgi:DNA-binding NarL/FixJ family response regulator
MKYPYSLDMKILLADPHPEVQHALHLIIDLIPEVTEVNEANNLIELLANCSHACPDLILFDLDLVRAYCIHPQSLVNLIEVFHRICPCCQVAAMSSRIDAEHEALAAGVNGFISKTDSPEEVLFDILRLLGINS